MGYKETGQAPEARSLDGKWMDLYSVSEICQALDRRVLLRVLGSPIELIATEILLHRSVLEHMVDGRED
jgi:hypothetical protein